MAYAYVVSLTAAYFIGTLVANRLAVGVRVNTSIMLGSALLLAGAALRLALPLISGLSTWSVLVPQMIWLMAMRILMPNAMAGAVSPFPTMAGAAASWLRHDGGQGLGGGVVSLALMMCALAAVGTVIFVWANRHGSHT
jgi:hypothetical protein